MKALGLLSLVAALTCAPLASAQSADIARVGGWLSDPANYRVEISGTIDEGPGGVVREDSELQVNVVMRNGVVIGIRADRRGTLTSTNDPARTMFHRTVRGEGAYVTSLRNVAAVEVIHHFNGAPPGMNTADLTAMHQRPERWFFNAIRLSARLFRRNPLTGAESLVEDREIVNARPHRFMSYGIWASARLPERFEPPPAMRNRDGYASVTVLTGADGMKVHPAVAEALIDTSGGILRLSARSLLLGPHRIWRAPSPPIRWNAIGRVGLRYQYGDHGPFDRDDWEIKAVLVDFCTRLASGASVCFRKASHYVYGVDTASIAVLNGDGAGTEIWAPFVTSRR